MPQDRLEQARTEALNLYQQGVHLQNLGDYDQAEDCYKRCNLIMKAIGNRNGEAASLHYMGTLLEARGDLIEARDCYRKSYQLFKEDEDLPNSVFSLFFQGILELKLDNYSEGISVLLNAMELAYYQGASYVQESWNRIRQMAGVLFARRKIGALIELGERLISMGEQLSSDRQNTHLMQRQLGQTTHKIGLLLLACGRYWHPSPNQQLFQETELVQWLLQTAVNLDQAPGTGLAFTDLVAKVIQEKPQTEGIQPNNFTNNQINQ